MRLTLTLIPPLVRAIDWKPLAVAVPVAVLLMAPLGMLSGDLSLIMRRAAALLLGSAAAFALVDTMDPDTASAPVPRGLRQWLRAGLASAVGAAAWAAVYAATTIRMPAEVRPPLLGAAVEAAILMAAGLVGAAFALRRQATRPRALSGGIVQFVVLLAIVPAAMAPLGSLVALSSLLLALAVANRDLRR